MKRILIANRSEIACRIIATCKTKGLKTVAVYTPEDKHSLHCQQADFALLLPQEGAAGYLDKNALIQLAHESGADAIHPGYGFLAENADFAQAVLDAGLCWIGPSPRIIHLMGNKIEARNAMIGAGVPVVPGAHCSNKIDAKNHAQAIGFPIIIKAALGGGGKAMRRVETEHDFESAYEMVERESEKLFLSREIFIEKYIDQARHIEIQIAGDGKNAIHLFERECSIQRRHQKVIEEAPCAFVSAQTLQSMYDTATRATKSIGYDSIGTFEFILMPDETFYFLEMNTRLQVEHGVTELTTKIDLVDLQLELATHKKLPFSQQDISRHGHAIECRILAENPYNNFAPASGTISLLQLPSMPNIRIDHALQVSMEITPFYDSMIAKALSWGQSRVQATSTLITALNSFYIAGLETNIPFLANLMKTVEFDTGAFHTQWLATYLPKKDASQHSDIKALIAYSLYKKQISKAQTQPSAKQYSYWKASLWR